MPDLLTVKDFFSDSSLPIQVLRREPQPPYGLHEHEFSELVICTGGQGLHITDTGGYPVTRGDVFVIQGKTSHGYSDLKNLYLVNILYMRDRLPIPELDIRRLPGYYALFILEPQYRRRHRFASRLHLSLDDLERAKGYIAKLESEILYEEPGSLFMATAIFMQLICFLARRYERRDTPAAESLLCIGSALSYIESNYANPIQLDDLTEIANMSKSSLVRAFRRGVGTSPIDYLLRVRTSKAAELLRNTTLSVTDVAYETGFTDSNYFTRCFRKMMGASPRSFRKIQG